MTSFEDCRRELLERGGPPAQGVYRRWLGRPGYQPVHDFVHGFVHRYLGEITREELLDARARSEHALGDVRSEEQLREVEDWTTGFAFEHLFHHYLEERRAVPTWQDFSAWLNGDAASFFIHPLLQDLDWHQADRERKHELRRAFRWRLGKFYYSAMRELELFVRLRQEYGLPVHYHLLADVLLRSDFWVNDDVVCIYFANPKYRDRDRGRKPQAEQFLGKADPPFRIHHVAIERQGYGNFWISSDASVERLAHTLGA
ncbi:hypothetical protein [Deinococcus apachensis]|uniref:hypothetical protein n=1 Tax=Deinococcus apachensis TaxID=309886 RepID=UPI00036876D4|nr:hypothetical protein [Deinococcus apachensis]